MMMIESSLQCNADSTRLHIDFYLQVTACLDLFMICQYGGIVLAVNVFVVEKVMLFIA